MTTYDANALATKSRAERVACHPTLYPSVMPHVFKDARSAIDAVSAYEATVNRSFSYFIGSFNPACPLTGYTVAMYLVAEDQNTLPKVPYGWLTDAA